MPENDQGQEPKQSQESPPVSDSPTKKDSPEETRKELREAIKGSNEVLCTATTVLPIFPDTITIDRAKVTVTKRTFFASADVMSMRIEDVLNATAVVGPIFGHLKITSRSMSAGSPFNVGMFWRNDALRVKRIIQGYIIALERNIDCSALGTSELAKMLEKLGEDDHQGV